LVISYRLKPVFKNHIFQFFNHIFKTVYLGDSWIHNITFITYYKIKNIICFNLVDFIQFQYLFFQTALKFKTYYDQDNDNQKNIIMYSLKKNIVIPTYIYIYIYIYDIHNR
jgi:hypothetical protein